MTITVERRSGHTPDPVAGSPRRRVWIAAAALLVITVVAASIALWTRHQVTARPLEAGSGESGWVDTAGQPAHDKSVGSFSIFQTEVRPHHAQSFGFWVHNPSSVTQTILGLRDPNAVTSEPSHIVVSTTDPSRARDPHRLTFTTDPVAVPPHQYRAVRYVLRSSVCWAGGRSETFSDVRLRVRVGSVTRTEDVSLGEQTGFVLVAERRTC